jgi:hypothetical protein
LVERCNRTAEVRGSTPLRSTGNSNTRWLNIRVRPAGVAISCGKMESCHTEKTTSLERGRRRHRRWGHPQSAPMACHRGRAVGRWRGRRYSRVSRSRCSCNQDPRRANRTRHRERQRDAWSESSSVRVEKSRAGQCCTKGEANTARPQPGGTLPPHPCANDNGFTGSRPFVRPAPSTPLVSSAPVPPLNHILQSTAFFRS